MHGDAAGRTLSRIADLHVDPTPSARMTGPPSWSACAPSASGWICRPVWPQDAWERAARLIHERFADDFAAENGHRTPATQPWAHLDEFHRESNRRQVRNDSGWSSRSAGTPGTPRTASRRRLRTPMSTGWPSRSMALRLLGLMPMPPSRWLAPSTKTGAASTGRRVALRPVRRRRPQDPRQVSTGTRPNTSRPSRQTALRSLADTLLSSPKLGYRSRPLWQRYRRAGIVSPTATQPHGRGRPQSAT